ncbi:hypothetical protein MAJ_09073, partial [Metarhizium majus ARSEF 297]
MTALITTQGGKNPFWRLALVFKCAADTIFLDDFKTVLDHIAESAFQRRGFSGAKPDSRSMSYYSPHQTRNTTLQGSCSERTPHLPGMGMEISAVQGRDTFARRHASAGPGIEFNHVEFGSESQQKKQSIIHTEIPV